MPAFAKSGHSTMLIFNTVTDSKRPEAVTVSLPRVRYANQHHYLYSSSPFIAVSSLQPRSLLEQHFDNDYPRGG